MQWLRLYHDTITDPKWRLVANDSGQTEANVLAVWVHMMINASASTERGTLDGWNDRIVGASLSIPGEAVAAIREAMQGLVLEGLRLTGWDKRQRASDNVADRVQRHRNKGKEPGPGGGSGNGFDNGGHRMSRDANDTVTLHSPDVTLHPTNETLPPLRAQTPELQTEESIPDHSPVEPAPAPSGAGEQKVAYIGAAFSLNLKTFSEFKARYFAIPDFMAALVSLDAQLAGTPPKKVYGALQARLNGMHQCELRIKAERAEKQRPKQPNRAGIRNLGPSRQAGAA